MLLKKKLFIKGEDFQTYLFGRNLAIEKIQSIKYNNKKIMEPNKMKFILLQRMQHLRHTFIGAWVFLSHALLEP